MPPPCLCATWVVLLRPASRLVFDTYFSYKCILAGDLMHVPSASLCCRYLLFRGSWRRLFLAAQSVLLRDLQISTSHCLFTANGGALRKRPVIYATANVMYGTLNLSYTIFNLLEGSGAAARPVPRISSWGKVAIVSVSASGLVDAGLCQFSLLFFLSCLSALAEWPALRPCASDIRGCRILEVDWLHNTPCLT